VKAQQ
jgi:H/ACA ribonucleoprotein complex subunit 4